MADDGFPRGVLRHADRIQRLRDGADLVDLDENCVCRIQVNGFPQIFDVGHKKIVSHELNPSIDDAITLIIESIERAGYKAGTRASGGDVSIALDCASSEFYNTETGLYEYKKEGQGRVLSSTEQAAYIQSLTEKYPIDSVEDGMSESDWTGWQILHGRIMNS